MEAQLQTNWCWAAVATSVSKYFDPLHSPWTQCEVVNRELGETTCCQDGSTTACNRPWYLEKAMDRVQHPVQWSGGYASVSDIMDMVGLNKPLSIRIGWLSNGQPTGSGHFVVIDGYAIRSGTAYIDVEDPILGASTYEYTELQMKYNNGNGIWTHSYYLQ